MSVALELVWNFKIGNRQHDFAGIICGGWRYDLKLQGILGELKRNTGGKLDQLFFQRLQRKAVEGVSRDREGIAFR
ncbi:hypothetical protein D3C80_2085630 [compost metagenome]